MAFKDRMLCACTRMSGSVTSAQVAERQKNKRPGECLCFFAEHLGKQMGLTHKAQ